MSDHPLARTTDVLVEPLDDELLVFDSRVGRAHSLNPTAAAVWRASDGTRTRDQLAADCGLDPMLVDLALESLSASQLLVEFVASSERLSRRAVLRRSVLAGAGLGAALPVIRSITAPTPAMAASTKKATRNAKNGGDCRGIGVSACSPGSSCKCYPIDSGSCYCVRPEGASCYPGSPNPSGGLRNVSRCNFPSRGNGGGSYSSYCPSTGVCPS